MALYFAFLEGGHILCETRKQETFLQIAGQSRGFSREKQFIPACGTHANMWPFNFFRRQFLKSRTLLVQSTQHFNFSQNWNWNFDWKSFSISEKTYKNTNWCYNIFNLGGRWWGTILFITQTLKENKTGEKTKEKKKLSRQNAAETVVDKELSLMRTSMKQTTKMDGNTTPYSIRGIRAKHEYKQSKTST